MAEALPLQGLTFLNTRDARGAPALTQMLAELGAEVVECPTIEFVPPASWTPFDSRLEQITKDDWVVFTSANAVRATMERIWELNRPPAVLGRGRLAAIGRSTKNALERHKLTVELMPRIAQQEALLDALLSALRRSDKVWIPRAQEARELLVDGLRTAGYPVTVTPVYRTVMPRDGLGRARDALLAGRIDWMLFTSTSTVTNFFELLDEATRTALAQRWPRVACIGAVTAEAVRDQGLAVAVVPSRQDLEGMLAAVVDTVQGGGTTPRPRA
ncbi:MAG TPA: uroporphyrinogen-III synthase [bacterium]|nr:uroporphyrinogen-III synthase [bacterium]